MTSAREGFNRKLVEAFLDWPNKRSIGSVEDAIMSAYDASIKRVVGEMEAENMEHDSGRHLEVRGANRLRRQQLREAGLE